MNTESRRCQRRFLIWMAVYSAVIVADGFLLPRPPRLDPLHVVAALIPMVPLVFAGTASFASVRAMDELQRRIQLEGWLFGIIATSVVILSLGLLQWMAAVPTFSVGWLWPVLCGFYGIGAALAQRRYR